MSRSFQQAFDDWWACCVPKSSGPDEVRYVSVTNMAAIAKSLAMVVFKAGFETGGPSIEDDIHLIERASLSWPPGAGAAWKRLRKRLLDQAELSKLKDAFGQ